MSDTFIETTNRSWFSRIKSAFGGIIFGIILVIAAVVTLFWNEGRAVKTANALHEGAGIVKTIDPQALPTTANGQLVHFSGTLVPQGVAQDTFFTGVRAPDGAIRLVRNVEMYQWKESSSSETRKKLGGGEETVTTYSYAKTWSNKAIDSSRFKKPAGHENPQMPITGEVFPVASGTVGNITLEGKDFSNLGDAVALMPDARMTNQVRSRLNDGRIVAANGEAITVSRNQNSTSIGDLRISFESGDSETLSAIGALQNDTIKPYETSNGRTIMMFRSGIADAKAMFDSALSSNTMLTWGLRLLGFLAMLIGFRAIFSIIGVLGDVIPIIGDVFRFATGLAALAMAAVLSTLIIGFTWIYYRPLLGAGIILVGLAIAAGALVLGKKRARAQAANQPQPDPAIA